jgi:hypothetical protein
MRTGNDTVNDPGRDCGADGDDDILDGVAEEKPVMEGVASLAEIPRINSYSGQRTTSRDFDCSEESQ